MLKEVIKYCENKVYHSLYTYTISSIHILIFHFLFHSMCLFAFVDIVMRFLRFSSHFFFCIHACSLAQISSNIHLNSNIRFDFATLVLPFYQSFLPILIFSFLLSLRFQSEMTSLFAKNIMNIIIRHAIYYKILIMKYDHIGTQQRIFTTANTLGNTIL